ncbi:MAG TPA: hypothetical protein VF476_11600 [Chitinophagaceae bacterium]
MKYALSRLFAVLIFILFAFGSYSQPVKNENKPYKILTSGKQVTVKSNKNIRNIMVWTASGHRIIEQKDINASLYTFNVTNVKEKAFFVMIQYTEGKPYTEKIGVQ